MILNKEVEITLNGANFKHFRSFGYDNLKSGNKLIVPIEHLNKGSHSIIRVKCDVCGKEKETTYNNYLRNIKKYHIYTCSNKCAMVKNKKTNLEKYGVELLINTDIFKDKSKKTCLEKYGYESALKNIEIKNKRIKTNLEKYGVEYGFQNEEIKEKIKKSCLKKYGVENYTQTDQYKINMGFLLDKDILDKWELYQKQSRRIIYRIKSKVFENWNGYDHYDGEYIKENFSYEKTDKKYPTIDHKVSVYVGFMNNIPVEEINRMENLVITKRSINSSKGILDKPSLL